MTQEIDKEAVLALLSRWALGELDSRELHEAAEALMDAVPRVPEWPGVGLADPTWGPRIVIGLLADLPHELLFAEDVEALRALLDDDTPAPIRKLAWQSACDKIDWPARELRAKATPYYSQWHAPRPPDRSG